MIREYAQIRMTTDLDNPFPGMNPWLWDHWHSLHSRLLTYCCDAIAEQLPPGLAALTEERVVIDSPRFGPGKTVVPDVAVEERWDGSGAARSADGLAVVEPHVAILEDPVERWIEIVDGSGALITVIEVISPSNKDNEARRAAYRSKQHVYQEGGINLVEIDLLCEGKRVFLTPDKYYDYGPTWHSPYGVSLWRANDPARVFFVQINFRQRLPIIPIPLREQDADARLDLQAVIDEAYRKGRYGYLIDYRGGPSAELPQEDQRWAEALLREKGFREDD